jgi:WD40 repeat protein
MLARYDPVGKRTAVVTTVGVSLHSDDGAVGPVGGDLAERSARMALSADGRSLAIAGESSGIVTAFDLTTGQTVGLPFTADEPAARLAFVPDGSAFVVSTSRSVTRVPLDGSAPSVLVDSAQGPLGPAAIAPDGSWIVVPITSADAARVALWRPEGLSIIDIPIADGMNARDAVASPSGTHVGVVTETRDDPLEARLAIWDVPQGSLTGTISLVSSGAATPWAFGPDDRVLVADGAVTSLWSPSGEQLLTVDAPEANPTQSVFGIGDGLGFMTVLQDGTIDLWDRDGGGLATIGESGTTLVDVAVAPDNSTVTTVDFFGAVRRWDIAAGGSSPSAPPTVVVDGVGVVNSVSFAPDGSALAFATSSGLVETIDETGGVIRSFEQPRGNVDSVAFSADSAAIASGMGERRGPESFDDTVTIFDAGSGAAAGQFGGEAEQVAGCAFFRNEVRFSPDGDLLAANSHDFTVSLYDASDGAIQYTFPAHESTVTDLAFSPNGDLLATASDASTVRVWSVADRQLVKEYTTPPGGYWSLVFGADGRTLVVSDVVGSVSVLDLDTGSVIRTFTGQKNRLAELAVSPDGSLVASGGDDNSVELWSTATGELVAQLPGHTEAVRTVSFSSDGTTLASGSSDATVRLWTLHAS